MNEEYYYKEFNISTPKSDSFSSPTLDSFSLPMEDSFSEGLSTIAPIISTIKRQNEILQERIIYLRGEIKQRGDKNVK